MHAAAFWHQQFIREKVPGKPAASKFYDWRERYGKMDEHNGWVPRDFWLED